MSDDDNNVVTKDDLQSALLADLGPAAQLVSWSLEDMTSKFDGATSTIKNARVKYTVAGQSKEVCYVVKSNPNRGRHTDYFMGLLFSKESNFYNKVIPALNTVLKDIGYSALSFPKCFHTRLEEAKEVMILENMKAAGYHMEHKGRGVNASYALLVLKELAKLHASSVLLQKKTPDKDLLDRFECFQKEWTEEFNYGGDFGKFMDGYLDIAIQMFEKIGGCEKVVNYIKKIRPNAWNLYREQLKRRAPFAVIIHGDCWINNMLFRNDSAGNPIDVRLFDLQGCRKASLALDLHHFLNLNVPDSVKQDKMDLFLSTYHSTFEEIMKAGGSEVPFTLEELKQEYNDRGFYGFVYSIMWLPNMVRNVEDAIDILDTGTENAQLKNTLKMVDTNPLLKSRILPIVEEWTRRGLVS